MNQLPNAQSNFLRTSREFPNNLEKLTFEVDKSYVDVANAVNNRILGIFPTNRSIVTGEGWFLKGNQKQQSFRQVYTFTSSTTFPIAHGLDFNSIERFTRLWGTFTDAAGNWYGILGASSVAIAGQLSFYVTPTNIVFLSGAGVPVMVRGSVVLEWLSNS